VGQSPLFNEITRALRIARLCEDHGISTAEGLDRVRRAEVELAAKRHRRREWLKTVARTGALGAAAYVTTPVRRALAGPQRTPPLDVGIVGAGIAGLACADVLAASGTVAALYDANTRTGGRCRSLRGFFPGQVAELGGELIDNLHKTMLHYARRFHLALEDVAKAPGEVFYYFGGRHVPEAAVVDEFREFVAAMHIDLRRLSGEVTALSHTAADEELDRTSLLAYLEGQNGATLAAGPIAKAAISEAYVAEYGLEPDEQSCLNFLFFIHADRRSKFTPFGVFSDERYHVLDGNDRIVDGLTQGLPRPVEYGMTLVAARRTSAGAVELTFETPGGGVLSRRHDAVVLAIPFTTLRNVELAANLDLPSEKRAAIARLGYGTNAKMMVGFERRPWIAQGSNGSSYSDLVNHQTTWETNPGRASATRAVITDYSGGDRGRSLDPDRVQLEANRFLTDLDLVFPGARAAARRIRGSVVAHLEHWPSNPLTLGSYTCYLPGQFTTIAGLESLPAANLYFAGEHANSFYEFQGFMEGAALSGIDVAAAILKAAALR
jgi:monoamine oxidase